MQINYTPRRLRGGVGAFADDEVGGECSGGVEGVRKTTGYPRWQRLLSTPPEFAVPISVGEGKLRPPPASGGGYSSAAACPPPAPPIKDGGGDSCVPAVVVVSAKYDCASCPAYCCGYPVVEAKPIDIRRLARHFGVSAEEAKERYTEKENNRVRRMKQRHDAKFGAKVCIFLNQKTRQCGVYSARPQICREYPGDRCEWNDRRLLEGIALRARMGPHAKVIRLKVAPWKIDADYPDYTGTKLPDLLNAYAGGRRGKMPERAARKKKKKKK